MATYSFTYSNPISIIFDIYFICILSDVSTILCYITNNLLYLVNAINESQRCPPPSVWQTGRGVCSFLSFPYRILSFCPTAMGPPSGMPLFL